MPNNEKVEVVTYRRGIVWYRRSPNRSGTPQNPPIPFPPSPPNRNPPAPRDSPGLGSASRSTSASASASASTPKLESNPPGVPSNSSSAPPVPLVKAPNSTPESRSGESRTLCGKDGEVGGGDASVEEVALDLLFVLRLDFDLLFLGLGMPT
ncbi:hypothetical protein B0H14DRAFT_2958073 [Mycena olivaceomarginata]|nr:hypothetical protein B0H14DRAFT_2958073 [Mycena olivaceomarginata]